MTGALAESLARQIAAIGRAPVPRLSARVVQYDGLILQCTGFPVSPGTLCRVETEAGGHVRGEVVGFAAGRTLLFLDASGAQIAAGARVDILGDGRTIRVGPGLLGRVTDAEGQPLDDLPAPVTEDTWPLRGKLTNPLARGPVSRPLDVGVRILNAVLSVGLGQRLGIMAGSGVGKSVLIEMMARHTSAEVVVVGLIGERAREVGAFVSKIMRDEAARRISIVAVPADRSPLLRLRAAHRATAVAEYFRAQGRQVLLIMDSLTRVAHAQREVGLALGEPPTAKGYPPSVISLIPALIERTGPGLPGEGAITAFYTVLADGDDANDPVVDSARAILDGHVFLSRRQTQLGVYPAVDVPQSVSRVMPDITDPDHRRAALRLRRLISLYQENRDLMLMGGYVPGQDAELDAAIRLWPQITDFIRQEPDTKADFPASREALLRLVS